MKRYFLCLLLLCLCGMAAVRTPAETDPPASVDQPSAAPVSILIVYYSRTGNTEKMARGVAEGVELVAAAKASLKRVAEVAKADLEAADGLILGCPTYFANIPGPMKTAMDDWNWKLGVDFTDKVGGAFATAGGPTGGQGHVVTSLLLFMLNNRMIVAGPLYRNEKTGSIWGEPGAGAVTGPLDPGVDDDELDAARRLGRRIARIAGELKSLRTAQASPGVIRECSEGDMANGKGSETWRVDDQVQALHRRSCRSGDI